jgi:hypothetical protein
VVSGGDVDLSDLEALVDQQVPDAIGAAVGPADPNVVLGLRVVAGARALEREYAVTARVIDVQHAIGADADLVVAIAADALRAVARGELAWDEAVARGAVHVTDRALDVHRDGVRPSPVDPLFLRYAFP